MTPFESVSRLVSEFCEWCNSPPSDGRAEAHRLLALLLGLYQGLSQLPKPEYCGAEVEVDRIDDDSWRRVFKRCSALPFQYYSEVFDPHVVPGEDPVVGDVADDVADIYRDLSEVLALQAAGQTKAADWQLVFSFRTHWGRHASSAIRALHCWLEDNDAW